MLSTTSTEPKPSKPWDSRSRRCRRRAWSWLRSHNGLLRVTLPVDETAVDVAGARVRGKVYGRSFPGPTLRVRPGDTLDLLVNVRLFRPNHWREDEDGNKIATCRARRIVITD
jgi:hypothetical protein